MIRSVNRVSKVLETIHSNPGIQFRDLMEQTGMKNGVLSHYVNKIEKNVFNNHPILLSNDFYNEITQ